MAQQLFANNSGSTLAGAITNVSTIANLAAGTGALFPSPGAGQYFVGTFVDAATGLINEIVWVTSRTGDQITMTRAQEGTTAKTWNSGDLFKMLVTAGALGQMLQNGQFQEQAFVHTGSDVGGSSNTIVATLAPAITTYAVGEVYRVELAHDITGAATINLNGIGAVTLTRSNGLPTQNGDAYAGQVIDVTWNGSVAQLLQLAPSAARPTTTTLTAGSGNYTTKSGCLALRIREIGGGGGGGGVGGTTPGGGGGNGGDTSFNSVVAKGGHGSAATAAGGAVSSGGVGGVGGTGTVTLRIGGQGGSGSAANFTSGGIGTPPSLPGYGGSSALGGAGSPDQSNNTTISAQSNSGSGGAGAVIGSPATSCGGGGGAGEYAEFWVTSPTGTYAYVVGIAGAAGTAGTGAGAAAGGAGGSGVIIIEEFYR